MSKTTRAVDSKELYKQLRAMPWGELWAGKVGAFDRATERERFERVSWVRAVGVVFVESGPVAQREEVKEWLRNLLSDKEEKIRRYAMAALVKLGMGTAEQSEVLALLEKTESAREGEFIGGVLGKVGGMAGLRALDGADRFSPQTLQKIQAGAARVQSPSVLRYTQELTRVESMRIHLRCRTGLEGILREEVESQGRFGVLRVDRGLVVVVGLRPFQLKDVFALRCFDTMGFVLDESGRSDASTSVEWVAQAITSAVSRRLLETLTEGSIRYRLSFVGKGHQRGAVVKVAERAFQLCPTVLNDAREAPWAVDVYQDRKGDTVELRPRLRPDPRDSYRLDDVPAASHRPLAACMARVGAKEKQGVVWDPFCGSGQELIERAILGGVDRVVGTDLSPEAVEICRKNFDAAQLGGVKGEFVCCDFRDFGMVPGLGPESVSLMISNPPLGRRVRIPDLRELITDLFAVAAKVLKPGGKLVFTNPVRMDCPNVSLALESRQVVDLGGFECRLESYRKKVVQGVVGGVRQGRGR